MKKGKPIRNPDWKGGFLFIGNNLALDFVNTRPIQNDEPIELLPDFRALMRWFQAAGLVRAGQAADLEQKWGGTSWARRTVEAMWELRERIRKELVGWEAGAAINPSTVKALNEMMADHPMQVRLKIRGSIPVRELWFELDRPEALFAPLADSIANLFASVDHGRIRKCDQCVLHFHDTSKKGTRRWCSMRLCGNRLKVAAYSARRRLHG